MRHPEFYTTDLSDIDWDRGILHCYADPPKVIDWLDGGDIRNDICVAKISPYFLTFASYKSREKFLERLFDDQERSPSVEVLYKIGFIRGVAVVAEIERA